MNEPLIIDFEIGELKSLVSKRLNYSKNLKQSVLGTIGELCVLKFLRIKGFESKLSENVFDAEKDIEFVDNFGNVCTAEVKSSYVLSYYKAFCESWKHQPKLTAVDYAFFVSSPNSLNKGFDRSTEGNIYLFRKGFDHKKHYHSSDIDKINPKILIPYNQPHAKVVAKISEPVLKYMEKFNTKRS